MQRKADSAFQTIDKNKSIRNFIAGRENWSGLRGQQLHHIWRKTLTDARSGHLQKRCGSGNPMSLHLQSPFQA